MFVLQDTFPRKRLHINHHLKHLFHENELGMRTVIKRGEIFLFFDILTGPPLWSSSQEFLATDQRSRVRFPALQDFLRSRGSGTWSTQPREVN
jgi:hypothetical protein